MSTATPLSSSAPPVFLDDPFDTESHSTSTTSTSLSNSPLSRPVDPATPIPEEDEEDETSSEAAEPLTPTDSHPPQTFLKMSEISHPAAIHPQLPLIISTAASPTSSASKTNTPTPSSPSPQTPAPTRKGNGSSTDGKISRAVSGFFRRTASHSAVSPEQGTNFADAGWAQEKRRGSVRRLSTTNSSCTTRSNTPPSPGAEDRERKTRLSEREPSQDEFFGKKSRASTGFSLRDRFHKHKNSLANPAKEERNRAASVDLDGVSESRPNFRNPDVQPMARAVWSMAAESGIGLKSRRLSLSLPDDLAVEVNELYKEYTDQSKILGRRGKSVGKGATANVRLMQRKGGSQGELYAVKEFRGKSSSETEAEYEKKIKSEFSIAKSVHHPNIVETYSLCTHNGKWNHVMEFCEQGDLFSLVKEKYLAKDEHMNDRLCLFKQLIQGLNYLHCNGIAHRDIKLENLLITNQSKLKITDFGVSEVFAGIHPGLRSAGGQCGRGMKGVRLCSPGICGSPPYIAPEVVAKEGEYDPRPLDVWGAAVVMLCMCANGCLWDKAIAGSSPIYDDLLRGWTAWTSTHPSPSSTISPDDYPKVAFFNTRINPPALRRILLSMLNPDPARRVSMATVAGNRWLKNVECCQVDGVEEGTLIDASKSAKCRGAGLVKQHNHLPPHSHVGHKFVRLPGSTEMR